MTTGKELFDPGSALVPVTDLPPVARSAEVVGTVRTLDGELVVRIRPTQYRDVTTRTVNQAAPESVHGHYRGCSCRLGTSVAYVGPLTPTERAKEAAAWARWMNPPWWAVVRWIPEQRRLRSELRQEAPRRAVAGHRPLELDAAPEGQLASGGGRP